MIFGLGLDLVLVPRMESVWRRHGERFVERCFTPAEAELCLSRKRPARALAMRFAAKEAFGKATGRGLAGFAWREIEVVHDERGRPFLALHGRAGAWVEEQGIKGCFLSLSDDGEYAAAVVALEK